MGAAQPVLPAGEPSLSTAMARVASATQGTIVRRIELMMLEHKELVSGWILEATLGLLGVGMGLAAWFTATTALVLYAAPELELGARLAILASIHAAATAAVFFVLLRVKSASGAARPTASAPHAADESHVE